MPVATLANAQSIGRTRAFLTIFIPLVGLLAGLLGFVYLVEVRTETRIFEQTEQKVVDSLEAVAMGVVAEVVSDVMFLAGHHALNEFLNGDTSQRHALEQDYLAFSRRKRIYDQIRYLDETGMEVVRVNFNGGNPKPVPTERLQNKGKHYYFAQVVREVLGDLETRIEELNGTVKLESLPTVDADPMQMRQLFQNLIGNALKFHKHDIAPTVSVSGRIVDDGTIEIMVSDNGIGFEAKHTERVFGTFQRLHGRSEYEGTGIGLSLCRKIIQRHHGQIKADPELRQIPVVVLTTSRAEEDILRTYDLGVSSFITKPVSFDGLVDVMRALATYWFEIVRLPAA